MNIIQALDSLRVGENAHTEYNWSEDIKEETVQLYFQLVRTKDMRTLERKVNDILKKAFSNTKQYESEIILLYKMIANVRDIAGNGKGEMDLSYMMLYCLYNYHPTMAYYLFEKFVIISEDHQYGSWKDVKYFCNYVKSKSNETHPFIGYIVRLTNYYLKSEIKKEQNTLNLLGKWIPREKSKKFGWLFRLLAKDYFSIYLQTAKTLSVQKKAVKKAHRSYRKILVVLNKKLNTVQIKMCDKDWASIQANQLTSKTLNKQMLSLLNQKWKIGKFVQLL